MPVLESSADTKYQHALPTVSFRIIDDDKSLLAPAGVHSEQSRSYGYNDFSEFERPEYYIRYIEPIESELAVQVEYDMDEQDKEWLDVINLERKKDQSGIISYEVFEIIMDKLEKEWFNLIKRIPQPASHMPVEDSKCAICDDGEGENSNAIVFCDGCNLAVHQDCYGVPYIPEGQWLCRKCTVSPENPVSCLFCPNEGGAFKQTNTGHWAHLLCAMWIPELNLVNPIYMEPVEGVEQVPKSRWKLICSLCRERSGACIQCDNKACFTAFHVTCARQMGFLESMKSMRSDGYIRAYCEKHLPNGRRGADSDDDGFPRVVTSKSARAHAKAYRPEPPIVPRMIVQKLLDYVAKLSIRKRQPFVERLCRYWSLKREARRGAPLLKRLHLEPWTANNSARQQTDAEKAKKLEFLMMLRADLEKVRLLAELARKREKEKLRQAQVIKDVVDAIIFPFYGKLRLTLEKVSAMDRGELFLHPVNRAEVPDYFDVIHEPMSWLQVDEKLEKNAYRDVADFKRDILLVLDNAMLYNSAETPFHRTAKRIKVNAHALLDDLHPSSDPEVGNLEPTLAALETLLAAPFTSTFPNNRDNLGDIFAFEMERPPPPRSPTPPPKIKVKRDYASRKQAWEEKEARRKERMAERETRASHAATRAFADEPGATEPTDTPVPSELAESSRGSRRKSGRHVDPAVTEPTPLSGVLVEQNVAKQRKPQVGVVGIETVAVLSDRERREQEKGLDILTDEVDAQDQFKRFNVGWVLPEGSKRRRTEPPPSRSSTSKDKAPSVAPSLSALEDRKPTSAAQASSPLSVLAESDSLTPPTTDILNPDTIRSTSSDAAIRVGHDDSRSKRKRQANKSSESTPIAKRRKGASSLTPPPEEGEAETGLGFETGTETRMEQTHPTRNAEGKFVKKSGRGRDRDAGAASIQDEDTPVPRSRVRSGGKAQVPVGSGRSASRLEQIEAGEEESSIEEDDAGMGDDEDEETIKRADSEIVDGEGEGEEGIDAEDVVVREHNEGVGEQEAEQKIEAGPNTQFLSTVDGADPYPPGTLVWAKLASFPFWPAEVIDPDDQFEPVPEIVLSHPDRTAHPGQARVWLVRFYDTQSSYGWIPASKLDMLGEDDEVDERHLSGRERNKSSTFRRSTVKQQCMKAYREALAAMAGEGDDVGA